jgi:tRNA-2-methylthio-N6-dimethylallyladenosine synthase
MNKYDSEILEGLLIKRGFKLASDVESAEIALFNTCSVREHAENRIWGQVGMLKKVKNNGYPLKIIGVIGCMAQAHKEEILNRLPHVDFVCGPQYIYEIPDYIESIISKNEKILAVKPKLRPADRENHSLRNRIEGVSAFVTIMEGCNNFCSYCVVPFVRGREVSRLHNSIIKEVEGLLEKGIKEVILLGQNVNSYGKDLKDGYGFMSLLEDLDRMPNLRRLRFVTSHPKDASEEMFKKMAKLPTVCESLHLPLQSGSDRILKSMNRKYTRDEYLRKVEVLRKLIPSCSISTDIIVGFPQETDEDFRQTQGMLESVRFDTAYIFKYSPRPHTRAAELEDDVPKRVKEERNQELLKVQKKIALNNNQRLVGERRGVLVEGLDKKNNFRLRGRIRSDRIVTFKGPENLIGKIVEVEIKKAGLANLEGEWKDK